MLTDNYHKTLSLSEAFYYINRQIKENEYKFKRIVREICMEDILRGTGDWKLIY